MKQIMLGNEAFARGAYEAGVSVVSSYPGTPSTEVTENLAKYDDIYVEWAPNEKVALETAFGAAVGGARSLCCLKHVGLNVAADPLFTAAYTGVNAGLAVLVADDPGMHSSQNEQDSRYYAKSAHLPMIEPSDSMEAVDYMIKAYEISEKFDTPVIIRTTTRISHSRGVAETHSRAEIEKKIYKKDPSKYVMMPANAKNRHIVLEKRIEELAEFAETTDLNRIEYNDNRIGIITSGICYNYVKEAVPQASVLKLGMVFPLPEDKIREFAANVDKLYVIEELEPFIEEQVKALGINAVGKELFTVQGEYTANNIKAALSNEGERAEEKQNDNQDIPPRPPVLCPGCPHRAVFYMINKLGLTSMGDIGCYTLGALPPLNAVDTTLCMGASIGMAHGMEKAGNNSDKLVSVIGDSTFLHSGITGLLNMAYNGATSTVVILDNSTTGMTGHQDHPATGKNAKGEPAPAVNLVELVKALGVKNVAVVDPFDTDELKKVLREETQRGELSVIIAQRSCKLLDKSKDDGALVIKDCRNCKSCMNLGCPALVQGKDGVEIDPAICVGCELCIEVCPFNAIGREEEQ